VGFLGGFFSDYKRIIAYSTSSQLCLIGMFFVVGSFLWSIFYVYIHAFFKASLFMLVRMIIHGVESQELKFFTNTIFWGFFVFCLLCMCGMPFLGVSRSKDDFLLRGGRFFVFYCIFFGVGTIFYSSVLISFLGWGFLGLFFGGGLFFGIFWLCLASFFNLNYIFCEFFGDFLRLWRLFCCFLVGFFGLKGFFGVFCYDIFWKFFGFFVFYLREKELKVFFGFFGFLEFFAMTFFGSFFGFFT